MSLPLVWLADVLRAAGLTVLEEPGWKTAGRPVSTGGFAPKAVIWHHDASAAGISPNEPGYLSHGRPPEAPGPLCQAWVRLDGVWVAIAAGRANHAGVGDGWGVIPEDQGNTYAVGIETDHTTGEKWPTAQLDSLRRGTAAILTRLDASPMLALCGHKEYAPGRKIDPAGLDLDSERRTVAAMMNGDDVDWSDNIPLTPASAVTFKRKEEQVEVLLSWIARDARLARESAARAEAYSKAAAEKSGLTPVDLAAIDKIVDTSLAAGLDVNVTVN